MYAYGEFLESSPAPVVEGDLVPKPIEVHSCLLTQSTTLVIPLQPMPPDRRLRTTGPCLSLHVRRRLHMSRPPPFHHDSRLPPNSLDQTRNKVMYFVGSLGRLPRWAQGAPHKPSQDQKQIRTSFAERNSSQNVVRFLSSLCVN